MVGNAGCDLWRSALNGHLWKRSENEFADGGAVFRRALRDRSIIFILFYIRRIYAVVVSSDSEAFGTFVDFFGGWVVDCESPSPR